ncbi:LuxR family transcriptional regulator [Sphingobium sp.]|uniref:helix-turn-helix transcriptional regulator n=1 Tax=Sphingobium sp. TaxID=1912891 RepID=UPI002C7C3A62|nr:LuxR family transcriptional regulator [Sphingobium sp.]HUD95362.1 LuxR family transcriptional regulator [Sphingobium sp.]
MIRTEEIYDAATDDAAFDQLASRLAESVGARSAVLHWGQGAAQVAEISYSGYFSAEQMAIYGQEFVHDDLWGAALDGRSANRIWDFDAVVPVATYEKSRIYNEWIRPMGDDTFHCLGGVIQRGDTVGHIGLHRGRTQKLFDDQERAVVQNIVDHVGRMFDIRHRLDRANHQGRTLQATLDLVEHAIFTLSASGRLVSCNAAGEAMLRRQDALLLRQHQIVARDPQSDSAMQAALRVATAREATQAGAVFLARERGLPYMLTVAAIWTGEERQVVLIATDPGAQDASLAGRVRALYGLSRAEADIVVALCEGKGLEDVSQERGVALSTVRTQMKNIFWKTDCSRQSELVSRLARLPRLGPINR